MRKRIFACLSLVTLAIVVLPVYDSYGASSPIVVQPSLMNFGDVRLGESRSSQIYIANFRAHPLRVNIKPYSPFLSVERTNLYLGPGDRASIRVVFRATGTHPGEKSGRVIINTDIGIYYVSWRANVVPPFGDMPPLPSDYNRGVSETYIELDEIGPGEVRKEIVLFNPFPYPITVRVEPRAPWIRPQQPYVIIPPFGRYNFPLIFFIEDFPTDILEGFLVLYFPWGPVEIRIVAKRPYGWYRPDHAVTVTPTYVDFGTVLYGEVKERGIMVRNNTPNSVRVVVLDTAPWLRVHPYEAYIAPYGSRAFRLVVNGSLLPRGLRHANVWIDTPYGRLNVRVTARGGL
ncbi:MAG: hypothetical protein NZ900_02675 [Synergistetes bacterium]|nr:hypothetical protein [Synergistota bacterium]MDW8191833.1 hypothetical protein [Synergistota bacterium]